MTDRAPATNRSPSRRLTRQRGNLAIFAWPLLLGIATITGLVLGLTGSGWRDSAAWLLLALGPIAIAVAWVRRN